MLAISSGMGGGAALLLLLVPVGRVTVTFPARAELVIGCQGTSSVSSAFSSALKIEASQYSCDAMHPYSYDVEMRVETCGFVCDWLPENGSLPIKDALSYAVKVRTPSEETTEVYRYPLTASDIPVSSMTDQNSLRALTNNERYKSALRRISDTTLFFPADGMYSLNCKKSYENVTDFFCEFGSNETVAGTMSKFFLAKVMPLTEKSNELAALSAYMDGGYSKEFTVEGLSEVTKNKGNLTEKDMQDAKFSEATCFDYYSTQDQEVSVEVLLHQRPNENKTKEDVAVAMLLTGCSPRCLATTPRHRLCSNLKEQVELDISLTFWSYMAVRVFIGIIGGTAFAMFEGAVIAILREHEADYGLQRIYGSIGGMISSPLSGMLIDYASQGKGYTDFRPAFYLYAVLKVVSGALMMTINLEFKSPASNLMNDVVTVLKNVEIVALFVACFVLGTAWGYIESFLFWLLQDLGGSRSLMGITITVGGIAGIPLLVMSGPIIERIGHANVLFIGFLFYSVRLLGYSLIYNPWMCLIFEALEGVTSSLAFTAAVTYAARLSTTTTDTSIQGLLGGLYYGVGKGSGSLIGGYLMKAFGTRPTYQIFAGGTLVTGCAYYLFNKLYLMKRPQVEGNDICKKHPKIKNIEANDKIENGINSDRSEKMRLKENKENVNLYLDNIPIKHIGIHNQSYQVGDGDIDKINDVVNQNIILGDGMKNSKTNGLENPAFVDTESSGIRDRKRLGKGITHADMENVKIESIGDIHNK